MTDQPNASPPLPGRAVDIVYAAFRAAGRDVFRITAQPTGYGAGIEVHPKSGPFIEADARAVFTVLGAAPESCRWWHSEVNNCWLGTAAGPVPVLGGQLDITLTSPTDPRQVPTDQDVAAVAALVADVDALRAADLAQVPA